MPKQYLTAKFIDGLKPPKSGQIDYFDTAVPAFGVRNQRKGKLFFLIRRNHEGERKRIRLGYWPDVTLAEARAAGIDSRAYEIGDLRALAEVLEHVGLDPDYIGERLLEESLWDPEIVLRTLAAIDSVR